MGAAVFLVAAWIGALGAGMVARTGFSRIERVSPGAQGAFWLLLAAAPLATGLAGLTATLLPSFGLAPDHCLTHSHHPHLCLNHPQALSLTAALISAIGLARFVMASATELRLAWRARQTIAELDPLARTHGDLRVLPGKLPSAFVIGLLRPRIYVSQATLTLPAPVFAPVIAHERCHVAHRHLLVRALARVLGSLHWPSVAREIDRRLASSQELQADEAAAGAVGDRLLVADSLLQFARARVGAPGGALAFIDGGVEARVLALSSDAPHQSSRPLVILATTSLIAFASIVASPATVHHALETALGWLH
jgi:hypothetical protein